MVVTKIELRPRKAAVDRSPRKSAHHAPHRRMSYGDITREHCVAGNVEAVFLLTRGGRLSLFAISPVEADAFPLVDHERGQARERLDGRPVEVDADGLLPAACSADFDVVQAVLEDARINDHSMCRDVHDLQPHRPGPSHHYTPQHHINGPSSVGADLDAGHGEWHVHVVQDDVIKENAVSSMVYQDPETGAPRVPQHAAGDLA